MGATRFLATVVRCSAAVAVLFAGSTATLGQGRAAIRFDSARTALDACISASAAVENARSLLKAKNSTYHPFIDSAQACVSDAQAAAAQPEWPTELRRRHRYVDRSLAAAATWLSRSENPRIEARFIRVARNVLAARRSLARAALLLDAVATPALNDDPVTPPPPIPAPSDFMWTDLVPSADSRVVYVSSSAGSDSNDGSSPEHPIKTIAHANSFMRDGYPDWILLKCGDTWTGTNLHPYDHPAGFGNTGSGRSASERMVYSSYGTGARPKIIDGIFMMGSPHYNSNHRAIVGMELTSTVKSDGDPFTQSGMLLFSGGTDVLIEDCYVHGFNQGLAILIDYNRTPVAPWYDVKLRRCIVADNYTISGGGSQGIITGGVHGLLFDGCIFDRNGWNPDVPGAIATIFNQNMYLNGNHPDNLSSNCTDVVVRGCITARASCTGCQMRNGGLCENNLFLQNPSALAFGTNREAGANGGTVRNNVVLDGRDITDSVNILPRGHAFDFDMLDAVDVYGNIIANQESGGQALAIDAGTSITGVSIHDNVVYNWKTQSGTGTSLQIGAHATGAVQVYDNDFQQPGVRDVYLCVLVWTGESSHFQFHDNRYFQGGNSNYFYYGPAYTFTTWSALMGETGSSEGAVTYPDPSRNIASYMTSLGKTATLEAFLAEVRKQSRGNWRPEYSAEAVNEYIRAGFGREAK